MKRKVIGGLLAFTAVTAIAMAFSNTFTPVQRVPAMAAQSVEVDSAPQTQFGIKEALYPPTLDRPAPSAPPPPQAVATSAATEAAAAASEAASAAADIHRIGDEPVTSGAIPVAMPKVAYTYSYGYRIAGKDIAALEAAHADSCEKLGPMTCRIISLRQVGEEDNGYASGTLELAVAAPRARSFGNELASAVKTAGGSQIATAITGEDLSKAIVDTEARLRARTVLRDRLMGVLASRKGTVEELVEAERGVAQVNEEIDQARSWLTEMQGRVQYSRMTINYVAAGAPVAAEQSGGFMAPIRNVLAGLGGLFGTAIALLIAALATLGPIGLATYGVVRLWRRYRPTIETRPDVEAALS